MLHELAENHRDLALFNMLIDSKLRGCDLIRLKVVNVRSSNQIDRPQSQRLRNPFNKKTKVTQIYKMRPAYAVFAIRYITVGNTGAIKASLRRV